MTTVLRKAFDESVHPRGQPENAGQFAPSEGASAAVDKAKEKIAGVSKQGRAESRQDRGDYLRGADRLIGSNATQPAVVKVREAFDTLRLAEGTDAGELKAAGATLKAAYDAYDADLVESLSKGGATPEEVAGLKKLLAKAAEKREALNAAVVAAAGEVPKWEAAAKEHADKEPDTTESIPDSELPPEPEEPEAPDDESGELEEPDEPERPDPNDYDEGTSDPDYKEDWIAYDKADDEYRQALSAWNKENAEADARNAANEQAYSAAIDKWEADKEKWEKQCEKLSDKWDKTREKEHDVWEKQAGKIDAKLSAATDKAESLWGEYEGELLEIDDKVTDAAQDVLTNALDRLDEEEQEDEADDDEEKAFVPRKKAFDESQHPRGQPENAGQFAPSEGASAAVEKAKESTEPKHDTTEKTDSGSTINDLKRAYLAVKQRYTSLSSVPFIGSNLSAAVDRLRSGDEKNAAMLLRGATEKQKAVVREVAEGMEKYATPYLERIAAIGKKKEPWELTKEEANQALTYNEMQEGVDVGDVRTFYRVGAPPASGRSFNTMTGKHEAGVSVYVTPTTGSVAGETNRPWYYGVGEVVGFGGDDEPVVKISDTWKKYPGHKAVIKEALAAGKPVPPEVLADYPDLAKKYGKKSLPHPARSLAVRYAEALGLRQDATAFILGKAFSAAYPELELCVKQVEDAQGHLHDEGDGKFTSGGPSEGAQEAVEKAKNPTSPGTAGRAVEALGKFGVPEGKAAKHVEKAMERLRKMKARGEEDDPEADVDEAFAPILDKLGEKFVDAELEKNAPGDERPANFGEIARAAREAEVVYRKQIVKELAAALGGGEKSLTVCSTEPPGVGWTYSGAGMWTKTGEGE